MKIIKQMLIFLLCALAFASCNMEKELQKNTGILADKNVVSSIIKDLEDKENSSLAGDGDVFWTASGALWHKSDDCSYLANSKEILHGPLDEAKLAGKERACQRCFATEEDKTYADLEDNPIENDHVFFSRDEKVWHTNINCLRLLGAEKIYNASVDTARELGKTSCCDECEK